MYARCAKQMTNVKLLFSLLRLLSSKERTHLAIDRVTASGIAHGAQRVE